MIHLQLKNFIMSVLPLSWLISTWKNFPEFWNQKVPAVISDFGYFERVPIARGPLACDRQFTLRKFYFNKNKVPGAVSSRSKFVYMTKSSFHNPLAMRSSLTYLYSSRTVLSSAEEAPRSEIVKGEKANIIYVREFSRSSSDPVPADPAPVRPAAPSLLPPGAPAAHPAEGARVVTTDGESLVPGEANIARISS